MGNFTGFANTLIATLLLTVASTLADLIWALWIPAHRAVFGLIHGALLFMALGLVLGVLAARDRDGSDCRQLLTLAAGGELFAGLGGAAAFYVMFPFIGWWAMLVAWMGLWILTAFLNRWIQDGTEPLPVTFGRGTAAALLSGAAFYLAVYPIWLGGQTKNPDYVLNLASWFVAFLPGFACLLLRQTNQK